MLELKIYNQETGKEEKKYTANKVPYIVTKKVMVTLANLFSDENVNIDINNIDKIPMDKLFTTLPVLMDAFEPFLFDIFRDLTQDELDYQTEASEIIPIFMQIFTSGFASLQGLGGNSKNAKRVQI